MDVFSVLTMLGGLSLFLFGMNYMNKGLEKLSGGKLERTLEKLSDNTIKAVLLGAGVTAVIQSSSATTVMVVGFVNSGIMKLSQAIGIIMGANVGTTTTAWILSLTGLEGDSVFVRLLKPDSFAPIFAVIGIILLTAYKNSKKADVGSILIGFATLMFGLSTMSDAMAPLADEPWFANALLLFENPFFGIAAGALLTAIIQSSSASVGILQALSVSGSITRGIALPIILGQNIGTCVTAMISSIGAGKNAKRAAFVHLYFNIIGSAVFLAAFYLLNIFIDFGVESAVNAADIALIHTVFNVSATLILLPFGKQLGRLATLTVRDKEKEKPADGLSPILDERFLGVPSFALEQCKNSTIQMALNSQNILLRSLEMLREYSSEGAAFIRRGENEVDCYEDKLGTYLLKLSACELSSSDSGEVSKLLHLIGDLERISDHAVNLLESAEELTEKKLSFSDSGGKELNVLLSAVGEIVVITTLALRNNDSKLALRVEPLEQVIDGIKNTLRDRHISRLLAGHCTTETGFIFSDVLTNLERVSDHCSNIAVCLIKLPQNSFETHKYLNTVKASGEEKFEADYAEFKAKYPV